MPEMRMLGSWTPARMRVRDGLRKVYVEAAGHGAGDARAAVGNEPDCVVVDW